MAEPVAASSAGPARGTTVGALLAAGAGMLSPTSASPRLDAELLLADVLGCDRAQLVLARDTPVGDGQRARFAELLHRRAAHEPVAYLLGRRGFRWLQLAVDSRVLVPRPETELLVEIGLTLPAGAAVIDVGTGSGAVALALKHERPDLDVRGIDVSADAVALATQNAATLSLDVSFIVGDLLADVAGPVDAVLANLPYIEQGALLPADIADHEPALALFGGPDGLDLIRRLIAMVAGEPWPVLLGLEIGETQGQAVTRLISEAGFADVQVVADLAGRDRVVVGRR